MKRYFILLLLPLFAVACQEKKAKGTNGITYTSAMQYNDYIVNRQTTLLSNILEFVEAAEIDLDSAENMLDRYVIQTGEMIREIKGMPAYKGDSALRDAAINSFGFYKKIFEKDYKDILHLRGEQDGLSTDIEARINAILRQVEKEEKLLDDRFHAAQEAFARKNNMQLIENDMQKKFEEKTGTN